MDAEDGGMKIRELIRRLETLNPDWDVCVQDSEFGYWDQDVAMCQFPGGIEVGPWQEAIDKPFVGIYQAPGLPSSS